MEKYQILKDKFVINDYENAKRFSSFLPGVAGVDGKPLWVFYANVGQCIGGFGTNSKDEIITPFDSALMAYQNIPLKSFRTFVQVNDDVIIEPFRYSSKTKLIVERSKITIHDENDYFSVDIVYSTVSHQSYPALIRKVSIKSKGDYDFKIIDGLPIFLPKGVSNYEYHELTTLVSAYCNVKINKNAPFYTYSNRGGDESKIVLKEDGNAFISIDQNNEVLDCIVDPCLIFGNDFTFNKPINFNKAFNKLDQKTSNCIPCAFVKKKISLKKDSTYEFVSLFGSFDSENHFNEIINKISFAFLKNEIQNTEELVESLIPDIHTSNYVFDSYVKQCYLDNGLRGGFPQLWNGNAIYLYSRKHGDMERDYNSFDIPCSYFSSGKGNFRDINQNRRNDLLLLPQIYDSNIYLFFSLIEANGFNPLLVDTTLINDRNLSFDECIKIVDKNVKTNIKADFCEGYWVDHWIYNIDLLENFIAVFPDKIESILFDKKYRFYDSGIRIKSRNERYVESNGKLRQYNCLEKIQNGDDKWLKNINGELIIVDLYSKLFSLIINKVALLDCNQIGLEMLADKPGWNDSCNGLPGLFGSSTNESIELLKLMKLFKDYLNLYKKDISVIDAQYDLFESLIDVSGKDIEIWNEINDAREKYENTYRHNKSLKMINYVEALKFINKYIKVLETGIKKAVSLGNGIIPTYFIHSPIINNGKIIGFDTTSAPLFLEGPSRLAKLGKEYFDHESLNNILKSNLFDNELKLLKTSEPLDNFTKEIGRVASFTPGWLERESDFLHMTFKFILGLVKAELYEDAFKLIKTNFPCFMDSNVYGRPLFENVSFIVSSMNPDLSKRGQGFYARLTGANTEVINILNCLFLGNNPFLFDKTLKFNIRPHIPLELFNNHRIEFPIFKDTKLIYENINNRDFNEQSNIVYKIKNIEYKDVPNEIVNRIRDGSIKEVTIIIK